MALLLCGALLTACGQLLSGHVYTELPTLKPGNYRLDPHHTTVLFKVEHLGISSFVGRFNQSQATLNFVDSDPAASTIVADVEINSLDVNRPDFAQTLVSCDWLCSEEHPVARFQSRGRANVDGSLLIFAGDLTFRGVTNPATLAVTINGATTNRLTGDYTLGFEAKLEFLRSRFGMDKFIPAVGDNVQIEVFAEFIRQ
ncbi:YceI family protein [Gilvimarinus sp. SDUM040013]|uniref:YceI family protein n=1 Tax=Gilvimarinus gilvus TaxID=3058038 RepID=A0ABU4RWC7_9GAMM|nr:YceI family protein [Gilvimarinus sp. SDUM040013]MDX6848486.1 YceI family protein [Gilvimarinus sp. SDUM040013]